MRPLMLVAISLAALIATACGGGGGKSKSAGTRSLRPCRASIGIEAPTTGPAASLGVEQVAFAKIALADDNKANGTHISLVQGNTQLSPALATTVAEQMIANPKIVAVVGPAGSQEAEAVGPLFGRAGMAFISGSATKTSLTDGGNPTFFRVVAMDALQGPQVAQFVSHKLRPRRLMIIDDQEPYSTGLVSAMIPVFRAAGITVDHESVSQRMTNFSTLVAKLTPHTTVVMLPWQVAATAQQFARTLVGQHKPTTIVGTDRLYAPGSFTTPGAYVTSYGPSGRLVYAATHVLDDAIAAVCKSGQTPTRSNALPAIKATDEATSILRRPIRFDARGNLINAKWFLFHINSAGQYQLVGSA